MPGATPKPSAEDLRRFKSKTDNQYDRNHLLLAWMSNDADRKEFFKLINENGGTLEFPSRDATPREPEPAGYDNPRKKSRPDHVDVTLVTDRSRIEDILKNCDKFLAQGHSYSNRVYAELGGGNFMLALDPSGKSDDHASVHALQRKAFGACFPANLETLKTMSAAAFRDAAVIGLCAEEFDLAVLAEQAALRYCQSMLGYAVQDFPLLQAALRAAYEGLVYQVHGRHFVTDPTVIPTAKAMMGRLLTRTSALIDAHATRDKDALKGCESAGRPTGQQSVIEKLSGPLGDLNGEQRAVIAVGAAIGMVGNVQAAVCIAVRGLYADDKPGGYSEQAANLVDYDRKAHRSPDLAPPESRRYESWKALIAHQLRANPPIPYLPRIEVDGAGNKVREYLLALGGGTKAYVGDDDPLVWGLPGTAPHNCAGQILAWPLIIEVVRQVMALPGLAQGLDPVDATVKGLKKLRGFQCLGYPFTYRRDRLRAQMPLNVAMRIKSPAKDHADALRMVIGAGAPRIEQLLREARHVHFAWFEFIESDTVLVLHTVYDGPFGAYLQHFAERAGDLFDLLFEHIEDPPPMPVKDFPDAFAAHLLGYNRLPAMGYFFSAYPRSEVAAIVRDERGRS